MKDSLPETAGELNSWINSHFQVFKGPSRAYFELTFPHCIGFEEERSYSETQHRVFYLTLAFRGTEDECCRSIAAHLRMQVTFEEFVDGTCPIFFCREFAFEQADPTFSTDTYVGGRVAFWDSRKNRNLIATAAYKPKGEIANKADLPKGWFEGWFDTRI
jgi:hypothetical protein